MKKMVSVILIALLSSPVFAQLENIPLITVTGESVIKATPDYVILGLRISKDLPINAQGIPTAFDIFKDQDTEIRLFDFDNNDITDSYIQVESTMYIKEVFITVKDIYKLDKYILELRKLGFKDYIYFDYRISNLESYKNKARKEAILAAKKKATFLAGEIEQTIGKAHLIDEIDTEDYHWYNSNKSDNLENVTYKLGADNYLIEPGYVTITSKIKVSFDLKK